RGHGDGRARVRRAHRARAADGVRAGAEPAHRTADGGLRRMTQEVAGLAPELKGAKKGQGQAPVLSASERFTAYEVEAFEVPGGREENWRFTPLRRLRGLHTDTVTFDGHATVEVEGAEAETVGRDDPRLGEGGVPADQGATAASHLQLRTTPFAEATVVIEQRGSGTLADNLEVVLAEGSRLTLFVTEEWADDAVHVGAHHFALGRDATLRTTTIALGGDLVRVSPTVNYRAPGGDAELFGLGFADAGQHLEQRLLVDHGEAHCRSRVNYKNALQGDSARTVWIGDVLIRSTAEATETFELNRNLILTTGARADSVPNLEIETGEIARAGHASATGRFDDEQLFYLQSRGIPEDVARRLVVRGFFGEILSKITIPELRARLEEA